MLPDRFTLARATRLVASTLVILGGCSSATPPAPPSPSLSSPLVFHTSDVPAPNGEAIAQRDPVQSRHMATRVMRIAAGARIPLHHHAGYDETFTVLEGALALELDGTTYRVRRGDVVIIPAGTTITGMNGPAESTIVVVWANTGAGEALTTAGANAAHAH